MVPEVGYIKLQNNQILNHYSTHLEIEKIEKEHSGSLWISRINAASRELRSFLFKLINSMSKKI